MKEFKIKHKNKTNGRYAKLKSELRKLNSIYCYISEKSKDEILAEIKYIEPIFFHYKNDASNVAAWRKDINNFKNFIIRLPRLVKFRFNIAQNIISVGGEIIKNKTSKHRDFWGQKQKFLFVKKNLATSIKQGHYTSIYQSCHLRLRRK